MKKARRVFLSLFAMCALGVSVAHAKDVEVLVIYTHAANAALSGETKEQDAADHELGFDLKTGADPDTEDFTINVTEVLKADSSYSEGPEWGDVLEEAHDGTIKVGGKTIDELRRIHGADIVALVATSSVLEQNGQLVSATGAAPVAVGQSNYIFGAKVNGSSPDGYTWLHETIHLLGVDEDDDGDCFQGDNTNDLCETEIDGIIDHGGNMADYAENLSAANPPHGADLDVDCLYASNFEVTIPNDSGIFDAVIERKPVGSGSWSETWSDDEEACIVRAGSWSYRAYFVDIFGNKGTYSSVQTASGSCGPPT